jgi:hypothetical protein
LAGRGKRDDGGGTHQNDGCASAERLGSKPGVRGHHERLPFLGRHPTPPAPVLAMNAGWHLDAIGMHV